MDGMSVRFWGVRGSLPAPGPSTLIYGGNTACIEIECGQRRLILDAGSGLRQLGRRLLDRGEPLDIDLLLTHCHLDHVIGLPFFAPAFIPGANVRLWAGHLSPPEHLEEVVAQLMVAPLLPITPEIFKAEVSYHDLPSGAAIDLGHGIEVATASLNHPGGATGYRVSYGGGTLCYITDHEHQPGGPEPALITLARGADLLVYDATFTDEEYRSRVGWGHSTWMEGIRLADAAAVGRLALFHHLPERDDEALASIERQADAVRPGTFAAREGTEFRLPGP